MNKKEIANMLRDYHWMINEIQRQRKVLESAGEKLTAQYGIESSMPKSNHGNSDPVAKEAIRREKKYSWINKLEFKVLFIQERLPFIKIEREKAVLECMLDGMSIKAIAKHMGFSERHIYIIRSQVIDRIMENVEGKCG